MATTSILAPKEKDNEIQKNNSEADPTLNEQGQEEEKQQENSITKGGKGRKRTCEVKKKGTKRAKLQQQDIEADNSCSDDEEPKEVVELEDEDEGNANKTIGKNSNTISSPGAPLAQSTPMVPQISSSTSSRSAFSMLQPPSGQQAASLSHHHQYMAPNPHHFPTPIGYYFPPPHAGAEQMFHPAAYPFMHWAPRAPAPPMGMAYPGGMMMPAPMAMAKMEPHEMGNGGDMEHSLLNLDTGNGCVKRKSKGGRKKSTIRKSNQNSGVDSGMGRNDSSMGNYSSILNSTDGGDTADDTFGNGESMIITDNSGVIIGHPAGDAAVGALHPINGFETYCTVPGRLTLLSNLKKYRVSIAEIQRRLSPPECLNASILGGILRKAKNKDGGRLLREQLMTYGVELTSGRRKQGPLTCFSSLVEEEASQLAFDFNCINQKNYPHKEAAAYAMTGVHNAQDASLYRMELYYASKFLNRIMEFHQADHSPLADQPKLEDGMVAELSPDLQEGLTHYSMLTHGFGGRVVKSMVETIQCVINECNNLLNRNYEQAGTSSHMDGNHSNTPIPLGYKY